MKIYLAGKITGDPDYRKKFEAAADYVRSQRPDAVILNPAVLPEGLTEQDYMTITGQMLSAADEVMCLADWEDSEGAKIEIRLAGKIGKRVGFLPALSAGIVSPMEFKARMAAIEKNAADSEAAHTAADELMTTTLRSLGYGEGIDIFDRLEIWYS